MEESQITGDRNRPRKTIKKDLEINEFEKDMVYILFYFYKNEGLSPETRKNYKEINRGVPIPIISANSKCLI